MSQATVVEALRCACSQDPAVLKLGEQQLKAWETEKGYYASLARVFADRSLDPGLRWMALTCVKNGVDRHWRPSAPNPIAEEEKVVVRGSLLQSLEESVLQVITQLSVLMARIARVDYPDRWPELLPFLTEGVRSSSEQQQKCCLTALQYVIKTLAGRRLAGYRKIFYDVTTNLFVYVARLWAGHLEASLSRVATGDTTEPLELSHICLKILRQMIVYGFPRFHSILEALQFLQNLFERIPALLQLRVQLPSGHPAVEQLELNIVLMAKILKDVQNHHPIGYVSFLTPSLELISITIFTPANEGQLFERYVVVMLNLFRQILQCEDYSPPRDLQLAESSPPPQVIEAHQAKLTFFKAETCQCILERLVGHLMLLTPEEIQNWQEDPEDYVQEKAGEMYQYSLRACVETAYMALFHEFQQTMAQYVVAMIQTVQASDASADQETLRLKESVYKAAGLGAYELYDEMDYDQWYSSQLLPELTVQDLRYKIVRNRVVWLLGNWVSVKMSASLRPSLYSVLLSVLQPSEDLVVRLTAADSIKSAVDDFGFEVSDFSPYLADAMRLLFQLLLDVKKSDTKMRVLNVLSLLMERMGASIQPHVSALLQYMPQLWAESDHSDSSLLRCVILTTLTNIVKGLGALSPGLHSFILPVVQLATDVKMPEHVYLAEDGLDLWLTTLRYATAPSPPLLQLLANIAGLLGLTPPSEEDSASSMAGLMDIDSDNLLVCFSIMDAYTVLCASDPAQFVQVCGEVVVRSCCSYINDVKPEAVVRIVRVSERIVQLYPSHFPQLLQPLLPVVIQKLLQEEDYPPTTAAYLTVLARVLLHNSAVFFSLIEQVAVQAQQTTAQFFGLVMDKWSDKLDAMTNVKDRKLTGLAIASLLPLADECVTRRFGVLLDMCLEVLHDVVDQTEEGVIYDTMVTPSSPSDEAQPIETEHDKREKQLAQYDPMRTVPLQRYVAGRLQECVAVHGVGYSSLMQTVDVVVREQLVEFLPQEQCRTLLAFEAI